MSVALSSPYAGFMGMTAARVDGRLIVTMAAADHLLGRPGFLHGGAMAGLVENAGWAVVLDRLDGAPVRLKPISISIDFLRGGRMVDTFATARIVRMGRRIVNVESWCWQDADETPLAIATMKFLQARPTADAPAEPDA